MKGHGGTLNACYQVKEAILKGTILTLTFWKRQNHGYSKRISGCQGLGEGSMKRWSKEDF